MRTLTNTRRALKMAALAAVLGLGILSGGCRSLLDQSELGSRKQYGDSKDRLERPLLSSIDPLDESLIEYADAQDVTDNDLKPFPVDYVISRNDFLQISVTDLSGGGVETVRQNRVSETGMLTLPLLTEPILAAGLTEMQLQKAIADKYREADVLKNAQVNVVVVEARGKTFYVKGAVARPAQYAIVDSDFRLLNALVQCGDIPNTAIEYDYIYIVRKLRSEQPSSSVKKPDVKKPVDATPEPEKPGNDPLKPDVDPLAPPAGAMGDAVKPYLAAAEGEGAIGIVDGKPIMIDGSQQVNPATQPAEAVKPADEPKIDAEPKVEPGKQPKFEFGKTLTPSEDERVIRVPLKKLNAGDLRYNVVIRPDDVIILPTPNVGFYYMGGHVGRPGAFMLNGTKVTLKQAIIGAGMLDDLAVPGKTDVIRRFDGNKEVYVRVDLADIFAGKTPDLFLKPNDTVVVGTDWYPPFLQAIRTSFRFSTGFGFLYDRNYAPQQKYAD